MNVQQKLQEWINAQNNSDLDTLIGLYAENGARIAGASEVRGRPALRELYAKVWAVLPERTMNVVHITAAGETVTLEYTERARHAGSFDTAFGTIPASNEMFEIHGCAVMQFENGHVTEARVYSDALFQMYALAHQLTS
jgi:steroid delta-isomerase-like uncharacterized protein